MHLCTNLLVSVACTLFLTLLCTWYEQLCAHVCAQNCAFVAAASWGFCMWGVGSVQFGNVGSSGDASAVALGLAAFLSSWAVLAFFGSLLLNVSVCVDPRM